MCSVDTYTAELGYVLFRSCIDQEHFLDMKPMWMEDIVTLVAVESFLQISRFDRYGGGGMKLY